MNGFVTESVGKISDGFINAIKLLLLYALLKFLLVTVQNFFQQPGVIVSIFVLLALAAFELKRCQLMKTSDQSRIWKGMASGLYFWQAFLLVAEMGSLSMFEEMGVVLWLMLGLFCFLLWKRVLPLGVKMGLFLFMTCWIGKVYFVIFDNVPDWLPVLVLAYRMIRYAVIASGVIAIVFVAYKSRTAASRGYAAILIFNAILYLLAAF